MKKNIFKIIFLFSLVLVLSGTAFSQGIFFGQENLASYANVQVCSGSGLGNILCNIQTFINSIIPILIALGMVYFVWGVVQYVIGGGEDAKTKGRDHIIWGLIGFAIIFSMWGIVNVVVRTFGVGAQTVSVPSLVPTTSASVSAATCDIGTKVQGLLNYGTCLIQNSIIPLMFALAIAFFIWGIIQFLILGASDENKRTQGRQHMIWGIIALTVMIGVWSLVKIVGGTFGLDTSILPAVKPSSTSN